MMHLMQPISLLTLLTLTTLLTPTPTSARPAHTTPPLQPLQPQRTWFIVPHSTDGRPAHTRASYLSPHDTTTTHVQSWLHTQPAGYARAAAEAVKTTEEALSRTVFGWIGRSRDARAYYAYDVPPPLESETQDEQRHHHHHRHRQHIRPSFTTLASSRFQHAARLYNYNSDYFGQRGREWLVGLASAPERVLFVLVGMVGALGGVFAVVRARMRFAREVGDEEGFVVVSGERKWGVGGVKKEERIEEEMVEREEKTNTKTKTKTLMGSPKLDGSLKWS